MKDKKPSGYWDNYNNCEEECAKYKYIRDLKINSPGCYYALIRNKWKDDFFPNRTRIQSKWEKKENCIEKAKRYNSLTVFARQAYDCYLSMKENGWLEEVFIITSSCNEKEYWSDYNNCRIECSKHRTLRELRRNNIKCYHSIINHRWKDCFLILNIKRLKSMVIGIILSIA